jgi:hypothetical protein
MNRLAVGSEICGLDHLICECFIVYGIRPLGYYIKGWGFPLQINVKLADWREEHMRGTIAVRLHQKDDDENEAMGLDRPSHTNPISGHARDRDPCAYGRAPGLFFIP